MIEKIIQFLNNIPADKVYHCLGGVVLFAIGELFGHGLVFAIAGAIIKELYDNQYPDHTPDVWDAVATILGGLLGFIIYLGY